MWVRHMRLVRCHGRGLLLEGGLEKRQVSYPLIRRRRGSRSCKTVSHLPLLLIAAPLAVHLVRPLPDQGRDRFQTVGGVNADGKFPSYVD